MKKTKRILAFILCMTLFIVPLPFSVNAAEVSYVHAEIVNGEIVVSTHNSVISFLANGHVCTNYEIIKLGNIIRKDYVCTADVCYRNVFDSAEGKCKVCGKTETFYNISQDCGHPGWVTFEDEFDIIHKQCPYCGYRVY